MSAKKARGSSECSLRTWGSFKHFSGYIHPLLKFQGLKIKLNIRYKNVPSLYPELLQTFRLGQSPAALINHIGSISNRPGEIILLLKISLVFLPGHSSLPCVAWWLLPVLYRWQWEKCAFCLHPCIYAPHYNGSAWRFAD